MPRNKGKTSQGRKVLSFFRVNFGYLPPYHVLCDGDMIHQSLKNDMYLKQSLPNILSGPAQPAVTSCVVEDLRSRGSEFSNAALFAKRVFRLPCAHEDNVDVTECIVERLRKDSEMKLMIAAANVDLLKKLTRIPGIPLISIFNRTKLVIRPPNRPTLDCVRDNEKIKTQTISDMDKSLLEQIKTDERAQRPQRITIRKKRKARAKGPNPLSVKKSKKQSNIRTDERNEGHKEGEDNSKVQQNRNTPSKLEMSTASNSVSGQRTVSNSRKRKRERRRASMGQNGADESEIAFPPSKARRKQVPVSNSVEGKPDKGILKGDDMRMGGNPDATMNSTMNSFGSEVNGNNNIQEQGPRKEGVGPNSVKDGANSFTFAGSTKQDNNVCGKRKQDGENGKKRGVSASQIRIAEGPESGKRKKQRKNRRRRPTNKQ